MNMALLPPIKASGIVRPVAVPVNARSRLPFSEAWQHLLLAGGSYGHRNAAAYGDIRTGREIAFQDRNAKRPRAAVRGARTAMEPCRGENPEDRTAHHAQSRYRRNEAATVAVW
jgi:hypothetical protein